jgi:hypothetical protein
MPHSAWGLLIPSAVETLLELNRIQEAYELGQRALERGTRLSFDFPLHRIICAFALAEAKHDLPREALRRIESLIAQQIEIGMHGLTLGYSYECAAQIAIWSRDKETLMKYLSLTAQAYRVEETSYLRVRYEPLLTAARKLEWLAPSEVQELSSSYLDTSTCSEVKSDISTEVTVLLKKERRRPQLAKQALERLCDATGTAGGHLFLIRKGRPAYGLSNDRENGFNVFEPLVSNYFDAKVHNEKGITGIENDCMGDSSPTEWMVNGSCYRPVLLSSFNDDECVCAGIFVYQYEKGEKPGSDLHTFTLNIANQLIDSKAIEVVEMEQVPSA